jgi:predicted dehydrogenase
VLAAGKHLLCEKPLTLTLAEARQVARAYVAARQRGVIGMVNFSHRGAHFYAAARLVAQGAIGEVRYVRSHYLQGWLASRGAWQRPGRAWRLQRRKGSAGVLGDLGCHLLDFTTGVCGPLRRLRCSLRTHPKIDTAGREIRYYDGAPLDANDSVSVVLDFTNGAFGNAQTSRWAAGRRNDVLLEIHGTEGGLSLGHTFPEKPFLRLCRGRALPKHEWKDLPVPRIVWTWERFIRAIRSGAAQPPDILRGAEVQALLDACLRSADSGRAETIRPWQ